MFKEALNDAASVEREWTVYAALCTDIEPSKSPVWRRLGAAMGSRSLPDFVRKNKLWEQQGFKTDFNMAIWAALRPQRNDENGLEMHMLSTVFIYQID